MKEGIMTQIRILEGTYKIRGKDVDLTGMVFPMVENFKVGAKGGYVTVDGSAVAGFPQRNIKIACAGSDSYEDAGSAKTVSYTHLTLPTIYSV